MIGKPNAMKYRVMCAGLAVVLAMLACGCQWEKPPEINRERVDSAQSIVAHMPPKELVKRIQNELQEPPLSLAVESVQEGMIRTGWKEYEGAIHIARRWRERTRFKIVVHPDFNDPLGTSHVEVFDETEEKPSDAQPWYPNRDLRRPERLDEVLKVIGSQKKSI